MRQTCERKPFRITAKSRTNTKVYTTEGTRKKPYRKVQNKPRKKSLKSSYTKLNIQVKTIPKHIKDQKNQIVDFPIHQTGTKNAQPKNQ